MENQQLYNLLNAIQHQMKMENRTKLQFYLSAVTPTPPIQTPVHVLEFRAIVHITGSDFFMTVNKKEAVTITKHLKS